MNASEWRWEKEEALDLSFYFTWLIAYCTKKSRRVQRFGHSMLNPQAPLVPPLWGHLINTCSGIIGNQINKYKPFPHPTLPVTSPLPVSLPPPTLTTQAAFFGLCVMTYGHLNFFTPLLVFCGEPDVRSSRT